MITGKNEELNGMAANNVCAADGGPLSVAWDATASIYYLRCGVCNATKGITHSKSVTEAYKAGEPLPPQVQDNVEKGIAKRQAKHPLPAGAVTMGGIPASDLGTGELLTLDVMKALVDYARGYGLDPRRGHVCLMYGKPYITIDGYLYHANKSGIFYTLASTPLTEETKKQYQVPDGAHAWLAQVTLKETGAYLTGLGIVTQEEMTAKSTKQPDRLRSPVVAAHPWQLAQKRAEWQALRRAFPIGESQEKNGEASIPV
jgi:hypothetical protein